MHTYLNELVAESIFIIREAFAVSRNPVILFSAGKDSTVLIDLARRAMQPARVRVPLLHIDTTWKFREMISYRDDLVRDLDLDLIVHTNRDALDEGVTPFSNQARYTDLMKTTALLDALRSYRFDAAVGGARRDEERSRAKERIFSLRNEYQRWHIREQRPELWRLFNARLSVDQSLRVFPLSNWTELDVWRYIERERLQVSGLYFSKIRPVVERDGTLIVVDDDRFPLRRPDEPQRQLVRFRTLGCYPLTGAVKSTAEDVAGVIRELETSRTSERRDRLVDRDGVGAMENRKQEGYF